MDKWFLGGWLYFFAACALSFVLPEWTGKENEIIENLQLLWLVGGMAYCWHMRSSKQLAWGGCASKLWSAGVIYFFLLFMRAGAGYFLLIQMAALSSITKWVFMASLCILSLLL